MPVVKNSGETTVRHRPKALTVFAAAFVAGAAAAVGVNRLLDVHIARSKPQIECEPIFVALRSLPQGAPVTVWDVALRDWPKAMLPGSALRAHDSFEGLLLRHPLREGQPLLAVQLMRAETSSGSRSGQSTTEAFVPPVPAAPSSAATAIPSAQADLWTPAESISRAERVPVPVQAPQPAAAVATDIAASSPATAQTVAESTVEPAAAPASDVTAVHTDLETTAVTSEPESAVERQTAEPAAAEPVAVDEPVATGNEQEVAAEDAGPQPEVVADVAVSPTPAASDIDPDTAAEAAPASDAAANDIDAPQPTDPATLPSVVTSKDEGQAAAQAPSREQPRRYLVVPERIALQADTSFSAPPAAKTVPPATVPPVTTATSSRTQQPEARQPAPRAASANRNGQPSAAPRQQAQPSRVQQPQQSRSQQVQPSRGQPAQSQQRPRPAATTSGSPQRGRERAFPNMAAGLDAISQQWQQLRSGEDDAAAPGRSAAAGTNDRRR